MSKIIAVSLLVLSTVAFAGEPVRIAVSDLLVDSEKQTYRNLGKGFSEIIAFELKKSPGVILIEREKRSELIEEMELSLNDLYDATKQVRIGKLLVADYLVSGNIIDMEDSLLINMEMVKIETGVIVWKEQVNESGKKYSYIGGYFAKSLLKWLELSVDATTEKAVAMKEDKNEDAVIKLSEGLDAYDKKDYTSAKINLDKVKQIDPSNQIADNYLNKIASGSAKFKVAPEKYVTYYNPAFLPGFKSDRVYFSTFFTRPSEGIPDQDSNQVPIIMKDATYGTAETSMGAIIGYVLPVTSDVGLCVELSMVSINNNILKTTGTPADPYMNYGNEMTDFYNGTISCGIALSPYFSLGGGASVSAKNRRYYEAVLATNEYLNAVTPVFGGELGLILKNPEGTLVFDTLGGWSTDNITPFSFTTELFYEKIGPIYNENTFTAAFNDKQTFIALKELNIINVDQNHFSMTITPCFEQWFFDIFSLRAGVECNIVFQNETTQWGWGGLAGATLHAGNLDIDLNATLRRRPARSITDVTIPEFVFFLTASWDRLFVQ